MAKTLDKVKDYLKGGKSPVAPLPDIFPPADLTWIRGEVGLPGKAERDGANNYPSPDATALSSVEQDIKGSFEELRDNYHETYESQLSIYGERIDGYNNMVELLLVNPDIESGLAELRTQQIIHMENEIAAAGQDLRARANGVLNFRKANRLEHRYPEIHEVRSKVWLWLVLAVGGELALNFFMLREAGSAIEVIAQTSLYGVVNVFLPFLLITGLLRQMWHFKTMHKVFGMLVLLFYVGYLLFVNLLMAHYRGAIIDSSTQILLAEYADESFFRQYMEAQSIAWSNFTEEWFGLNDIWSWFLCLGGVGLSLLGVYKGFKNDDPYPGYGEMKRSYDHQQNRYFDLVHDAIDEIQDRRDEVGNIIEGLVETLTQDHRSMPGLVDSARGLKDRCANAMSRLNTDFLMLIEEYRRINQFHRGQNPLPKYFSESPEIGEVTLREFRYRPINDCKQVVNMLHRQLDVLSRSHDDLVSRIRTLGDVLDGIEPFGVARA